eukprot:2135194-Amphidinium_carterae.1
MEFVWWGQVMMGPSLCVLSCPTETSGQLLCMDVVVIATGLKVTTVVCCQNHCRLKLRRMAARRLESPSAHIE